MKKGFLKNTVYIELIQNTLYCLNEHNLSQDTLIIITKYVLYLSLLYVLYLSLLYYVINSCNSLPV